MPKQDSFCLVVMIMIFIFAGCSGGSADSDSNNPPATNPKSWGGAFLIESNDTGDAFDPQIGFDGAGNAIAVWSQSDGTRENIFANRYDVVNGNWDVPVLIESNDNHAEQPQVAVSDAGNAIAVWEQWDGVRFNICSNRYDAASDSWYGAGLIETDNAGDAYAPQIGFDAYGNAIAVWYQHDGTRENIQANRFDYASGNWVGPQTIESGSDGGAYYPQIDFDGDGNAMVVWSQSDGIRGNIYANRYIAASSSWEGEELIENDDTGNAGGPQVSYDGDGNAIAVWAQDDGIRINIWANRYNATSGSWEGMVLLESENGGSAIFPQIAVGSTGNAMAVWEQYDGTRNNAWANHFNGVSWEGAELIENDDIGNAYRPHIVMALVIISWSTAMMMQVEVGREPS